MTVEPAFTPANRRSTAHSPSTPKPVAADGQRFAVRSEAMDLGPAAGLLKTKARIARKHGSWIAVTNAANEVRPNPRAWEERLIHAGVVEAGHGPAVQSQSPRSDDEVSALQRSVSHCRHLGHVWCRKVFLHDLGSVRQKLWQLAGEIQIVADNDRDRSLQNLRLIRFRSKPGERCLSIGATHPDKPCGAAVRRCRAPFQEVIDLAYQIVPYRTICPSVGGASGAKDLIKRPIV